MNDFDMNVILSNLLFNACEAISKSEKKEIRVVMEYDRGTLQIGVCNTYNGILSQKDGKFLSLKREVRAQGTGLMSVKRTVEKYNGYMEVEHTEKEFKVNNNAMGAVFSRAKALRKKGEKEETKWDTKR